MLVDILIWGVYPLTTVDALYLIGISLPIAYMFTKTNKWVRWAAIVVVFMATPVLQVVLGYTSYPTELTLFGQLTVIVPDQTSIFNHWIIDGWFPLFPWLGFSLLGVNLAESRFGQGGSAPVPQKNGLLRAGVLLLCFGAIIWVLYPGPLLVRLGYGELFYPPTIGYILTASGLFVLLLVIVDRSRSSFVYGPLKTFGASPLFMYILHLALIEYVFTLFLPDEILQVFLFSYLALTFVMGIVAYGLRALKARRPNLPVAARFFIGS